MSITPTDIEIFPASYDHLAIGVTFTAKLPGRLFDAKGTVWLTARPAVGKGGRSVRLDDIKVTRQIDNPLWSVVTAVVLTELPKTLGSSYTIDLASKIQDAMAKLNEAIADPKNTGDLKITVRNGNLRLGRISPRSERK